MDTYWFIAYIWHLFAFHTDKMCFISKVFASFLAYAFNTRSSLHNLKSTTINSLERNDFSVFHGSFFFANWVGIFVTLWKKRFGAMKNVLFLLIYSLRKLRSSSSCELFSRCELQSHRIGVTEENYWAKMWYIFVFLLMKTCSLSKNSNNS